MPVPRGCTAIIYCFTKQVLALPNSALFLLYCPQSRLNVINLAAYHRGAAPASFIASPNRSYFHGKTTGKRGELPEGPSFKGELPGKVALLDPAVLYDPYGLRRKWRR